MNWPDCGESRTVDLARVTICPQTHIRLLNDLEASAYGIIYASRIGVTGEYFEQICGPADGPILSTTGNTAVMAVGSGLGAAVIVRERMTRKLIVVPTEMGWCLAPAVGRRHTNFEGADALFEWGSHSYEGVLGPVYEDIVSGHGLVMNYSYLKNHPQEMDALAIVTKAQAGDLESLKAMSIYYRWYARCAQQLAIGFRCDSVLMALCHQVANRWLMQDLKVGLEKELNDTRRPDWTNDIRLFSQMKECNFNLLGASYIALQMAKP
jgi:glucokinase